MYFVLCCSIHKVSTRLANAIRQYCSKTDDIMLRKEVSHCQLYHNTGHIYKLLTTIHLSSQSTFKLQFPTRYSFAASHGAATVFTQSTVTAQGLGVLQRREKTGQRR